MNTISIKRAEQIARNINAMDLNYQYIDDGRKWRFWNDLNNKLRKILAELNEDDKYLIHSLCKPNKAEFFGLSARPEPIEENSKTKNMKQTFRTKVFQRAYEIMKSTGKSFAVCLSRSWALYRLLRQLRSKEKVTFTYEKKDGSLRRAIGTLKGVDGMITGTGRPSMETLRYYDLEASGFRSFRVENLVTVF